MRWLMPLAAVLSLSFPLAHAEQVSDMLQEARKAARNWEPDARLVFVQVTGYGFDLNPGIAGLKSDNLPKQANFYFYSPTAPEGKILFIGRQFNFSPDQQAILRQRPELEKMRQMETSSTMAPWQTGIPDGIMNVTDAVALAEKSGLDAECAGKNPFQGCGLITRAELHMFIIGAGEEIPIWRINFGQNEQAKEIVRLIDARSGKLITNCVVPDAGADLSARGNLYLECE